jgi:hypothetical protein
MKIRTLITMSILAAAVQTAPVALSQPPAGGQPGQDWKQNQRERFANLSPEEREKLKKARRQAMQDPTVQAAHDKMMQAGKEFRDVMEAAMLKADPSIKPVLDKMPKSPPPPPHQED